MAEERIRDLGESGILARIFPHFSQEKATLVGPGDDAAVLRAVGPIVMTTDAIVEGYDFLWGLSSPEHVGRKAAIQNLADVAAMGARPRWVLATVLASKETRASVLEGVSRGLGEECSRWGASVVGGDLGSASEFTVSITAVGELDAEGAAVTRSGARVGDVLAVGAPLLGMSAAGLAQVLGEADGAGPSWAKSRDGAAGERAHEVLEWHRAPRPNIALGWTSGRVASAMIDISDALVRDAGRIAEASGVRIDLDRELLTADAEFLAPLAAAYGVDVWDWVFGSGEEHAMLATFPREQWDAHEALRTDFREIGTVREASAGAPLVTADGEPIRVRGWDHFEG